MKYILLLFCYFATQVSAQNLNTKKPGTISLHAFYSDFKTAQDMKATSVSHVLNNRLWSETNEMQMGFGLSFHKGLTSKIDMVSTLDASSVDYLFRNGLSNGSNKLLLDFNAMANAKMLADNYFVVPYLSTGLGFSLYDGKMGLYVPAGAGLQFNIFGDGFVFTNFQYKLPVSNSVNHHFYYSLGIGVPVGKRKPAAAKPLKSIVVDTIAKLTPPAETKLPPKDVSISVADEQTGLPLPYVEVTVSGPEGKKLNGTTDANGFIVFNGVSQADYMVSGILNSINTNEQKIGKNKFEQGSGVIEINLLHSDPRFSLAGKVINKTTGKGEGNVAVNITNDTQKSIETKQSQNSNGVFISQLEAGSDFTIVGKKASYISNIEKLSTKGLNRSTTLYVKLELGIEEAAVGKDIVLSNIYYDLGKAEFRTSASTDIDKLYQFLVDNPGIRIEIASHSDSRGSDVANMKLSQLRAQAVAAYLIKKGIATNRLIAKGYGETRLVNGCSNGVKCTEEQHQQNRRTEFKVVR